MRAFSPAQPPCSRPAALMGSASLSAAFTPSSSTPVAGQNVTFTNGSTGAVSYSWDFGDGTVPNTATNPTHYFVGLGPYTVTLTATAADGSTDTSSGVISPTAPSANANLTLIKSYYFGGPDVTAASPDTFDNYRGTGDAITYSVPVGAKLAAVDDVGFSGYSSSFNNLMEWSIGQPLVTGTIYQLGAWFRFSSWPTTESVILGSRNPFYSIHGLFVNGSGQLINSYNSGVLTTLSLDTWYWIGLGFGGAATADAVNAKFMVRPISGSTTTYTTGANDRLYFRPGDSYNIGGGCFNVAGNVPFKMRMSALQLFTLSTLSNMAYPSDLVQPQTDNHIYRVDPVGGSDSNDGVMGAWQTVSKVNDMLDFVHGGLLSVGTDGVEGSGSHLTIDTSSQRFDVGTEGLIIATDYIKLCPVAGQSYIDFKPERIFAPGDWSAAAGHPGCYKATFVQVDSTRVWEDDIYLEPVADLTALDAAAAGASVLVSNVLYIKPFYGTDPSSNGRTYRAGRIRPDGNPIDNVGVPVVGAAAKDLWIDGVKTSYTAVNNNGSYAIGDLSNAGGNRPGFRGKLKVTNYDIRRYDKHAICFVHNATASTITVDTGYSELGIDAGLTSYMAGGGGSNVHVYKNLVARNQRMLPRTSTGQERPNAAIWYSHGGGGYQWSSIEHLNCDYRDNDCSSESGNITLAKWTDSTFGYLDEGNAVLMTGCTTSELPRFRNGGTMTANTITSVSPHYLAASEMDGTLAITNNTFTLLDFEGSNRPALFIAGASLSLTFTGNTVRFAPNASPIGSCPVFKDMASANIASCDNNTYYIGASAVFAKAFNAGGGAQDYTFAQWQALGYDTNSTRIDP